MMSHLRAARTHNSDATQCEWVIPNQHQFARKLAEHRAYKAAHLTTRRCSLEQYILQFPFIDVHCLGEAGELGVDLGNQISWERHPWDRELESKQLTSSVPCNEEDHQPSIDEDENDGQEHDDLLFTTEEFENEATKAASGSGSEDGVNWEQDSIGSVRDHWCKEEDLPSVVPTVAPT